MKRTLFLPLLLLAFGSLHAQEIEPEFPGGYEGLCRFIDSNLCYPQEAIDYHIEGRVFITFTIEASGYAHNPQILRGLPGDCNQAALDLVARMPLWKPGGVRYADGTKKIQPVTYNLPVRFSLDPLSPRRVRVGQTSSPLEARFPGGTGALYRFLANNIDYPRQFWSRKMETTVWIDSVGNVTKVDVDQRNYRLPDELQGLAPAVEKALKQMPRWRPAHRAISNDSLIEPIPATYSIPIDLQLLASMHDTLFRPQYTKGSKYQDSQWKLILAHENYIRQLISVNDSLLAGFTVTAERIQSLMPRDKGEFLTLCNIDDFYSNGDGMKIMDTAAKLALADSLDMMEHFLRWFNWSDGWVSELVYDYGVRIEKRFPEKFRRLMYKVCPEVWPDYEDWRDELLEWENKQQK